MLMKNFKAVIFDMDGTLLDTLDDLYLSLNHALAECGYNERSKAEIQSFIGDGVDVLIARAMPDELKADIQTDSEKANNFADKCRRVGEVFRAYYIEHGEDHTLPYDGILKLLETLKANGIKTAVVSNKVQEAVDRLNDRLFGGLIGVAVGDRAGVRLKPEPDMLFAALSRLDVSKDEAVFVGDGDTDIIAASRAGLPCISVCYGYRTEEFLRNSGGKTFAHSAQELATLLGINQI